MAGNDETGRTRPNFPVKGRPVDAVLRELEARTERDFHYGDGRIAGSMISAPHPLTYDVFARALEKNVGDPGLFPGSVELELEAVHFLADLLHGPATAGGHLVTGGNEANIVAMWVARAVARGRGERRSRLLVPEHAHVSWDKAASLLDLDLERIELDEDHRMRTARLVDRLGSDVLAVVAAAGCTPLGCVDPIEEIGACVSGSGIWFHVDAAYGGLVLPFLRNETDGRKTPVFDFRVRAVDSITIDPHKMGLAAQPAGGLLFRDESKSRAVEVAIPYLAGGKSSQATLTGTRSGAAALSVWALIQHLGLEGYRAIVDEAMEKTRRFATRVRASYRLELVVEPSMNILGVRPVRGDIPSFVQRLRFASWAIGEFKTHARIVFLPHLTDDRLEALFDALEEAASN
ncbi:MAG: tyrosine decarboxylase MfnA [Planctomycetes bacterium]|nr:tyrosine decarboxylase MfnA [Planctomycetota bacterium]MCB9917984.1 tyrosine decarboxylase MfnA [Planctomycetota bacterium]